MCASLWDCLHALMTWQLASCSERSSAKSQCALRSRLSSNNHDLISTCLHRSALTNGEGTASGHTCQELILVAVVADIHAPPQFKWFLWEMRNIADYVQGLHSAATSLANEPTMPLVSPPI